MFQKKILILNPIKWKAFKDTIIPYKKQIVTKLHFMLINKLNTE